MISITMNSLEKIQRQFLKFLIFCENGMYQTICYPQSNLLPVKGCYTSQIWVASEKSNTRDEPKLAQKHLIQTGQLNNKPKKATGNYLSKLFPGISLRLTIKEWPSVTRIRRISRSANFFRIKTIMRIGTWKVQSMFQIGKAAHTIKELPR